MEQMRAVLSKPSTMPLTMVEKDLIWKYRFWLSENKQVGHISVIITHQSLQHSGYHSILVIDDDAEVSFPAAERTSQVSTMACIHMHMRMQMHSCVHMHTSMYASKLHASQHGSGDVAGTVEVP